MQCIRICLGHMPGLLHDILIQGFSTEPDMHVVGEQAENQSLEGLCRRASPHVLVLDAKRVSDADFRSVFLVDQDLKVVIVGASGREAWLYRLRWRIDVVSDLSFPSLRDAIRASAEALRPVPGPAGNLPHVAGGRGS